MLCYLPYYHKYFNLNRVSSQSSQSFKLILQKCLIRLLFKWKLNSYFLFSLYHSFIFWIIHCLKLPPLLFEVINYNYKNQWVKVVLIKCFWRCYLHFRMILFKKTLITFIEKVFLFRQTYCITITISLLLQTVHSKYSLCSLPYYRKFVDENRLRSQCGRSL